MASICTGNVEMSKWSGPRVSFHYHQSFLTPIAHECTMATMNKAFMREPDRSDEAHCPRCGSLGLPVGRETLQEFLTPEAMATVSETAFFCPFPTCEIVYFDVFDRTVGGRAVKRAIYPKDPGAPICGCFGFKRDEIELDVAEGVVNRCRELINKSKSPEAKCVIMSADGRCCVSEVQRIFMKLRQAAEAARGP